jgi:hypothetical protein
LPNQHVVKSSEGGISLNIVHNWHEIGESHFDMWKEKQYWTFCSCKPSHC